MENNNNSNQLIKEKIVFGKTKSKYIFQVGVSLKPHQTLQQGLQIYGFFNVVIEKKLKNYAYIITNNEGKIDSISSSCINVLGIDQRYVL